MKRINVTKLAQLAENFEQEAHTLRSGELPIGSKPIDREPSIDVVTPPTNERERLMRHVAHRLSRVSDIAAELADSFKRDDEEIVSDLIPIQFETMENDLHQVKKAYYYFRRL